jgi:AraC-like DNA-binding protein/quercetin dioxygenase-like cupin family protein
MEYAKTLLNEELVVKKIVTVHYFEYAKDYVFEGEKHDFWEFVFVDKGVVEVMADTVGYKLKHGDIIFHKPNEFHNVWANGHVAPNLIIVSFECKSPAMAYFDGKILKIGDVEKGLLAQIIRESINSFLSPLNDTFLKKLEKRKNSEFGSEQLVKIYLEQLLISLIRKGASGKNDMKLSHSVKERSDSDMIKKIISYMEENIKHNLSFDDICRFSSLSRSNIKTLFKDKTHSGAMEYFKKLKVEEAKRMIREETSNFTEMADILGYTSIHYFSRHFKNATGMSPSQYALSVKVKI